MERFDSSLQKRTPALEAINNEVANANSYFDSCDTSLGQFWVSRHVLDEDKHYFTSPPPGIHLGAGISTLKTRYANHIEVNCKGPVLTLLVVPKDSVAPFQTHIKSGEHLSCGLHIDFKTLYDSKVITNSLLPLISTDNLSFHTFASAHELIYSLCGSTQYWNDQNSFDIAMQARALNLIALIIKELNNQNVPKPSHLMTKLASAKTLINKEYSKPLTIASIATHVGMSTRALSGHFKDAFGITIKEALFRTRMEQALQFLRDGRSVSETAYLVGYSNNHFSTRFSKHFGFPPCEFSIQLLPKTGTTMPDPG